MRWYLLILLLCVQKCTPQFIFTETEEVSYQIGKSFFGNDYLVIYVHCLTTFKAVFIIYFHAHSFTYIHIIIKTCCSLERL